MGLLVTAQTEAPVHHSMNVALIAGSQNRNSQTRKLARYMQQRLTNLNLANPSETFLHDLGEDPLPFWTSETAGQQAKTLNSEFLAKADAFVILSPDWNGMATPAVKNWFIHASAEALAHKPALLCGVSAGGGAVYPVADLRAHSFKNCRICFIPDHLVVRDTAKYFNSPQPVEPAEQLIIDRIDFTLHVLASYAQGLKAIRSLLPPTPKDFRFGM